MPTYREESRQVRQAAGVDSVAVTVSHSAYLVDPHERHALRAHTARATRQRARRAHSPRERCQSQ